MIKTFKKILMVLVVVCIALQGFTFVTSAATSKVTLTVSSAKPLVGETITVKAIIYTDVAGGLGAVNDGYLTYNSSVLKLTSWGGETMPDGAGRVIFDIQPDSKGSTGVTITLKFKVLKAGTANFKFSGVLVDWDEAYPAKTISASKSITAIDKSSLPKDANIKSIKLSAGSLSPKFSSSTTSYTVKVPYSTTKVVVTPTLSDAKAKWSISGSSSLKVGENTRVITVTAQNGSTKKYTIKITREKDTTTSKPTTPSEPTTPEVNPYEISVNGEMWVLLNDYSLITVPAGLSVAKQVINGIEMPVLLDAKRNRTIVYATNESDTIGSYFIYTGEDNEYTEYKFFVTDASTYVIVEPQNVAEAPDGFKYQETEVMGYQVGVYKYTDTAYADYVIFYAESPEGEKNYYRYDTDEATVQRATDFIIALGKMDDDKTQKGNIIDKFLKLDNQTKIIVCSALVLVLLIIALIIINIAKLSSGKPKKINETEVNVDDESQALDFETIIDGKLNGVIMSDQEE